MPDTGARVAVLVACHDDGATIRETIDSLRAEPDTELVVVDDGSTDGPTLADARGPRTRRNSRPPSGERRAVRRLDARPRRDDDAVRDALLVGRSARRRRDCATRRCARCESGRRGGLGRPAELRSRGGARSERSCSQPVARHLRQHHSGDCAVQTDVPPRGRRLAAPHRDRGLGSLDAPGGARLSRRVRARRRRSCTGGMRAGASAAVCGGSTRSTTSCASETVRSSMHARRTAATPPHPPMLKVLLPRRRSAAARIASPQGPALRRTVAAVLARRCPEDGPDPRARPALPDEAAQAGRA